MNKSESIKELAIALSKFQAEIKNPPNTKTVAAGKSFSYKYAPLDEILNLVRPLLSKHGLSVVQAPAGDGENITVSTLLIHESGEWIETDPLVLKADKPTAQGAGSAITYARRYALSAILGISSEDDDDVSSLEPNNRVKNQTFKKQSNKADEDKQAIVDNSLASDSQINAIFAIANKKNYTKENLDNYILSIHGKKSIKEISKKEASDIIQMLQGLGE